MACIRRRCRHAASDFRLPDMGRLDVDIITMINVVPLFFFFILNVNATFSKSSTMSTIFQK